MRVRDNESCAISLAVISAAFGKADNVTRLLANKLHRVAGVPSRRKTDSARKMPRIAARKLFSFGARSTNIPRAFMGLCLDRYTNTDARALHATPFRFLRRCRRRCNTRVRCIER